MTLPNWQAAGAASSATGAPALSWPTHATGDIGLLVLETANEALTGVITGWTEVVNSPQGTGTAGAAGATRLSVYWKRAASSGESGAFADDPGDHWVGQIVTIRGCIATGNPVQTSAGDTVASTGTISVPGGTTTAVDELVVFISSWDIDSTDPGVNGSQDDPSGLASTTRRVLSGSIAGNGGGFALWTATKAAPGTFGPLVTAQDTPSVQAHLMLALRSEADSAVATPALVYRPMQA